MIRKGSRHLSQIHKGTREVHCLTKGTRPIYVSSAAAHAASKAWLDANVTTVPTVVEDATARWFEMEIILPGAFTGNPVDGWTDGTIQLGLFWSRDLASWAAGNWIAAPGKSTITLGDGRKKHFARYSQTPIWWIDVMIDLTISSNRYAKSITGLTIYGAAVSLPNYPYDMPSEAAQLQTDLRAAGYTGALVTSVAAPLTVGINNHLSSGPLSLPVTLSGTNVTAVSDAGVTISLPGYPYSMPSQRATLQTDLRTAGKSGAVVKLFDDVWTLFLPDRLATANTRDITLTFSPGDPFPGFDMFGNSTGEQPNNGVLGYFDNVRTPAGAPLDEAMAAFARVGFINIPVLT